MKPKASKNENDNAEPKENSNQIDLDTQLSNELCCTKHSQHQELSSYWEENKETLLKYIPVILDWECLLSRADQVAGSNLGWSQHHSNY